MHIHASQLGDVFLVQVSGGDHHSNRIDGVQVGNHITSTTSFSLVCEVDLKCMLC